MCFFLLLLLVWLHSRPLAAGSAAAQESRDLIKPFMFLKSLFHKEPSRPSSNIIIIKAQPQIATNSATGTPTTTTETTGTKTATEPTTPTGITTSIDTDTASDFNQPSGGEAGERVSVRHEAAINLDDARVQEIVEKLLNPTKTMKNRLSNNKNNNLKIKKAKKQIHRKLKTFARNKKFHKLLQQQQQHQINIESLLANLNLAKKLDYYANNNSVNDDAKSNNNNN